MLVLVYCSTVKENVTRPSVFCPVYGKFQDVRPQLNPVKAKIEAERGKMQVVTLDE